MNQEQYNEVIEKIMVAWPKGRIIRVTEDKTLLRCDNDTFIKFTLLKLPDDMLTDPSIPKVTKDTLHEKLLIQWTDDLEKKTYTNIGFYLHRNELPEGEAIQDALRELAFRTQISKILI